MKIQDTGVQINHSFKTLSWKVTISRHGTRAVLQRRQPAVCWLVSDRTASFFHRGIQRLRSRFIARKLRF